MEEIRKLLLKDIEERELINIGLKRVKSRQTILILIGVLILIMFTFNFFQTRDQIKASNDVVHAARLIIQSQDSTIDSLISVDSLSK